LNPTNQPTFLNRSAGERITGEKQPDPFYCFARAVSVIRGAVPPAWHTFDRRCPPTY
jgi:hypothetical protein